MPERSVKLEHELTRHVIFPSNGPNNNDPLETLWSRYYSDIMKVRADGGTIRYKKDEDENRYKVIISSTFDPRWIVFLIAENGKMFRYAGVVD